MKTKHLFLATALMASFAACTNEEIVSDVQQNVATGRPTVDNVKLTFGENVDSRLIYNKGWKWEATDKIGALLMDAPTDKWHVINTPWAEKYELSHHIHTSYPFSYNSEEGTWGTPGKMLEGNYFFAFPWESYEGQRQVAHSLINQKQTGVTADVRAESYADNQFFIGYDRIVAGTQDAEALDNVSMTSILGAIELRLVNTGTQTYNINKVVLSGDKLASQLTFDPKDTYEYLTEEKFNSANYLDLDEEKAWTLDESYNKKYDRDEALRMVVKPIADENNDNFAQIIIEGEDREMLPDAENTAYILIMANPFEVETADELYLSIYTDEGYVSGIDLTKINKSSSKYGYVTDAKVEEVHPEVKNVIEIQLDDNAFETPEAMDIYNTQDLEQFILWNAKISGKREISATLKKNVELTEAAYEALIGKDNLELTIEGEKVLTLAAELPTDVLDAENLVLDDEVAVKVLGEVVLTKASEKPASIEVVEGAELTINDSQVKTVNVVNYGALTIGKNGNLATSSAIENNGTMTVAAGANVKAAITNNKTIELAGDLHNVALNAEEAVITMEEGAIMDVTTNEGIIETEDEVELTVATNKGFIAFVEGADVAVTTEKGYTARKVSGNVPNESTDPASPVNTWVVTKDATFAADASIKHMIVEDGADITVAKNKTLTVQNLIIQGVTTTEGTIKVVGPNNTAGTLIVEEDGDLTNDGNIEGQGVFKNYGYIDSNDNIKFNIAGYETDFVEGDYKGDIRFDVSLTDLEQAMKTAVEELVDSWIVNKSNIASWKDVTFNAVKETGWGELSSEWAIAARKELVDAYNDLKEAEFEAEDEDDEYEEIEYTDEEAIEGIFDANKSVVEARIAKVKSDASTTLKAAVTSAINNTVFTINWKNLSTAGYAYTGVVADYSDMWIAYANFLNANMASWYGTNAETQKKELIYSNEDGSLKRVYKFAIIAEINDKIDAKTPATPSVAIPAKSYLDASDKTGAKYVVLEYYINNVWTGNTVDLTLSNIKTWIAGLNQDNLTDASKLAAKAVVGSHISTVIGWNDGDAELTAANLTRLAELVKATKVETATALTSALTNQNIKTIILTGAIKNSELTINRDVTIKGGTLEGIVTVAAGKNVTFDGVTFANAHNTAGEATALNIKGGNANVNVLNCTFKNYDWDAIQAGNFTGTGVLSIIGNTFKAVDAPNENGSYIHVAATKSSDKFSNQIVIKYNTFGDAGNMKDNPVKIYGMNNFSQLTVGGNTFANAFNEEKVNEKAQVFVGKGFSYEEKKANGFSYAGKLYDAKKAYDAFTGTPAALKD